MVGRGKIKSPDVGFPHPRSLIPPRECGHFRSFDIAGTGHDDRMYYDTTPDAEAELLDDGRDARRDRENVNETQPTEPDHLGATRRASGGMKRAHTARPSVTPGCAWASADARFVSETHGATPPQACTCILSRSEEKPPH